MASGLIAGRSASTLMRATWKTTTTRAVVVGTSSATRNAATTTTRRVSFSPSIHPSLTLHSPPRLLRRRELSSLLPLHTAIASACLVSKLPAEAAASPDALGRFANYLSPI